MHGFSSSFPQGGPGVGLVLLRLAVAWQLLSGTPPGLPWWQLTLCCVMTLLLVLGMLTPLAGGFSILYQLAGLIHTELSAAPLLAIAALTATALVLLGPGAYAADARLFGRRRLLLPPDPAQVIGSKDYSIHLGEKK